jgi:hypothetical protein
MSESLGALIPSTRFSPVSLLVFFVARKMNRLVGVSEGVE